MSQNPIRSVVVQLIWQDVLTTPFRPKLLLLKVKLPDLKVVYFIIIHRFWNAKLVSEILWDLILFSPVLFVLLNNLIKLVLEPFKFDPLQVIYFILVLVKDVIFNVILKIFSLHLLSVLNRLALIIVMIFTFK
jgi:hypothetical protein